MASKDAPKCIIIRGERRTVREAIVVSAAVTPGDLGVIDSAGKVKKHDVAGGKAQPMFILENDLVGGNIDTDIAVADICQYAVCQSGDQVYAWVAAAAAAIAVGDLLESDGAGGLRKFVGLTDSSGGTADATVAAIGTEFSQAEIANNFADLAAQVNAIKGGAIARALVAVNNSAGSSRARIKVEVI